MMDLPTRLEQELSVVREQYSDRKKTFQEIMKTAKRIEEENPDALRDLVKVLGLKWQMIYMTHPLMSASSSLPLDPNEEWFGYGNEERPLILTPDGKDFYDLIITRRQVRILSLSRDLVIPTKILPDQFRKSVFCLKEDNWSSNRIGYTGWIWEPAGIAMIRDHDSTLTRGILQGQGEIEMHYISDYSTVYEFVHCDGEYFIRTWDGYKLAPVFDVALAAIFEVGRMRLKLQNRELQSA